MTEITVPFALYDAFSDTLFGGSQGGVVLNAGDIDAETRQSIASELGFPATCFVSSVIGPQVTARFHSTDREYPMCGHGTICLMTHLLQKNMLHLGTNGVLEVDLVLPSTTARVELLYQGENLPLVLLDIALPKFLNNQPDIGTLAGLLGLDEAEINNKYPAETAFGDFVHLLVPIKNLKAIQSIEPDFPAITAFCRDNGIETIACFSTETTLAGYDFHVRDFCPAVGVAESAATGTTNAALAAYWYWHGFIRGGDTGLNKLRVEQGLELGRPSSIHISLHSKNKEIYRLQVGGVARKVLEGQIQLPQKEQNRT